MGRVEEVVMVEGHEDFFLLSRTVVEFSIHKPGFSAYTLHYSQLIRKVYDYGFKYLKEKGQPEYTKTTHTTHRTNNVPRTSTFTVLRW